MTSLTYTLERGAAPNPVFNAACAYLDAAENVFLKETERDTHWLYVPNWFVSHHLSVIATELFLKSFHVTVSHGPVTSPDGPDDERFEKAFLGHRSGIDQLPNAVSSDLQAYLPKKLYELMQTLSSSQISKGRYPYEPNKEQDSGCVFPPGDYGRELAVDWMTLAKELRQYGNYGNATLAELVDGSRHRNPDMD